MEYYPPYFLASHWSISSFSCKIFEATCLKNLDQICPKLKRVEIARYLGVEEFGEWLHEDEVDGPFEIFHERLEELELRGITRSSIRVACTNLKKLVMRWGVYEDSISSWTLTFPTVVCPRLKSLELCFFDHILRSLPEILSVLPSLESLRIQRI